MSSYRNSYIYVRRNIRQRLDLIAIATSKSSDEVADELLDEAINAKFPRMLELELQISKTVREELTKDDSPLVA